ATANRSTPQSDRFRTSLDAIALRFSATLTARTWWTGKDSNLRSPQGAADLQSAGFSHQPTRPVKILWHANYESRTCPATTCRHTAQKHKKDACQETPARSRYKTGFDTTSLPCKMQGR